MSARYKFKADKNYTTVQFNGTQLSVGDLKKVIIDQRKLDDQHPDFDLKIINTHTKEAYTNDSTGILDNTTVIAVQVSKAKELKKEQLGSVGPKEKVKKGGDAPKPKQQKSPVSGQCPLTPKAQVAQKATESSSTNHEAVPTSVTLSKENKSTEKSSSKENKKIEKSSSKEKVSTTAPSVKQGRREKRHVSESQSRVQNLFDHFPRSNESVNISESSLSKQPGIHSIFYTLGLRYLDGRILGSNSRCLALLDAIKEYIECYSTPEGKDFRYDFAQKLKVNLDYLRRCRPFAVAMDNAVEAFNTMCHGLALGGSGVVPHTDETSLKEEWIEFLADFKFRIEKAKDAIVEKSVDKIKSGDTILIFGYSEVIRDVLAAVSMNPEKCFNLIVVDSRPLEREKKGKGLEILYAMRPGLDSDRISVTYTSITGISAIIQSVTKVFLGAHALLANGGVLAHAGTSQIALMASAHNIPVLVCCETYKFCDKSPTDSFFHNELSIGFGAVQTVSRHGHGKAFEINETLTPNPGTETCQGQDELGLLNSLQEDGYLITPVIKYDVTPPDFVTAVITDVDILPCTSVPVVLRVQENRKLTSLSRS